MNFNESDHKLKLTMNHSFWKSEKAKKQGYDFTDEEINKAYLHREKFIGTKNSVDCYLYIQF